MKRAVEFGFVEAKRSDPDGHVGTGHLLLGVLLEGSGAGARALLELGAGLDRVRAEIERITAAGVDEARAGGANAVRSLGWSPELSSALESAREIARAEQAPAVNLDHLARAMRDRS